MLSKGSTAIAGLSTRTCGGRCRRCRRRLRCQRLNAKGAHRLRQVLQRLLAEVFEPRLHAMAQRALDGFRDADAAGLGERLQPRGGVDAVAVHRAVGLLDDVAEVHADAKAHLAALLLRRGTRCQFVLHRECREDGAGGRLEHGQDGVPGHVDDPALACRDVLVEHSARAIQRLDRAGLVGRHQARIARGVGSEDRCEPSPCRRFAQVLCLLRWRRRRIAGRRRGQW